MLHRTTPSCEPSRCAATKRFATQSGYKLVDMRGTEGGEPPRDCEVTRETLEPPAEVRAVLPTSEGTAKDLKTLVGEISDSTPHFFEGVGDQVGKLQKLLAPLAQSSVSPIQRTGAGTRNSAHRYWRESPEGVK